MHSRPLGRTAILSGLLAGLVVSGVLAQESKKIFFLEFVHEKPRQLYIAHGASEVDPEAYLYMVYTLTNTDDVDHPFYLQVQAADDAGNSYRDGYHPTPLERIRKRLGNEAVVVLKDGSKEEGRLEINGDRYDLDQGTKSKSLRSSEVESVQYKLWGHRDVTTPETPGGTKVTGPRPLGEPYEIARPIIKAGETRRCVAIFRGVSKQMDRLTIDVTGLTNDIIIEAVADHRRKITERVYQIVYKRPGDEFYPSMDAMSFVSKGWVDRERTIKTDLKQPKEAE